MRRLCSLSGSVYKYLLTGCVSTKGIIRGHHRGSVNAKGFFSQVCQKPPQLFCFDLSSSLLLNSNTFFGFKMFGKKGEKQKPLEDSAVREHFLLKTSLYFKQYLSTSPSKKIYLFFTTAGGLSLDSPQNIQGDLAGAKLRRYRFLAATSSYI